VVFMFVQFEFGISALLLSPVTSSILAFLRSLQAEHMVLTKKVCKVCYHRTVKDI
jgi:hypothetical protein